METARRRRRFIPGGRQGAGLLRGGEGHLQIVRKAFGEARPLYRRLITGRREIEGDEGS